MSYFRTVIDIPQSDFKISHNQYIMMLGSCFSNNIGKMLKSRKFHVLCNPYGIIYNPYSVQEVLQHIMGFRKMEKTDFIETNNLWYSYLHHGGFKNKQKKLLEEQINQTRNEAIEFLKQTDYLFITFGTAWVYQLKKTMRIVTNCHKMPDKHFNRFRLASCDIADEFHQLIRQLEELNPTMRIIFTVSPIRHLRDGAIENQLSKAILSLALHELTSVHSHCSYFPSYEIMMDDLRDYRFYAEDMTHPSDQAVKYIFNRFSDTYFSSSTINILHQTQKIQQALAHRPFNEQSSEYLSFLQKTKNKIEQLTSQFKSMDWNQELEEIDKRIKTIKNTDA